MKIKMDDKKLIIKYRNRKVYEDIYNKYVKILWE